MKNVIFPTFKTVELCLTYRCNMKCANCSNLCTQAPAHGDLTPNDVSAFVRDSLAHEHLWDQITLHGGEPVLNPWIYDIVRILANYREKTGVKLWLSTNNSCKEIRERVTRISLCYDIPLGVSTKQKVNVDGSGNPIEYIAVNESPTDINEDYTLGCFQSSDCGVCFNNNGYYPCSPLAASARVFGYAPIGKSIKDLTMEKCLDYFNLHCKHCGFAVPNRRRVVNQLTTKTWYDAFAKYKRGNL